MTDATPRALPALHFLSTADVSMRDQGLRIARSRTWLVSRLELAGDSLSRRRGLLDRDSLPAGAGLVIAPSQGVHTFGMRFPIDVIGLDRTGHVVRLKVSVRPGRIVLAWRAFAILEVPEGTARRAGLELGDQLELLPFTR
jgi:uncharacterized membrane protein (UPF0127 family)